MATSHQPLLSTPNIKSSPCKSLCLILSLAAIIASVSIVTTNLISNAHLSDHPPLPSRICSLALDQPSCLSMVSELLASASAGRLTQINDLDLLQLFLKNSASSIQKTMEIASEISHRINDPRKQAAMADCMELMDISRERIMDSIEALGNWTSSSRSDAHSWLSSVLTNHVTCRDGLGGSLIEAELKDLIARARTSLAMVVALISPRLPTTIKDEIFQPLSGRFPSWVTARDRKLLEGAAKDIKADVVVAQDGSGKYKTVKEAVDSAPNNGKSRYVIYVKKGSYKENVEIGMTKKNVMLVGDGMDSTIITGSLNVVDGSTTFKSATVGNYLTLRLTSYRIFIFFFH